MFSRHDKSLLPIHPHDTIKLQVSSLTNLLKRPSRRNLVVKWTAEADVAFTAPRSRKHLHEQFFQYILCLNQCRRIGSYKGRGFSKPIHSIYYYEVRYYRSPNVNIALPMTDRKTFIYDIQQSQTCGLRFRRATREIYYEIILTLRFYRSIDIRYIASEDTISSSLRIVYIIDPLLSFLKTSKSTKISSFYLDMLLYTCTYIHYIPTIARYKSVSILVHL